MRIETALKKQSNMVAHMLDMCGRAEHFGLTSAEVIAESNRVLTSYGKVPNWVTQYVRGYRDALQAKWYTEGVLVFGGFMAGKFYSVFNRREDYYGNTMSAKEWNDNSVKKGHYWRASLRPYFIGEQG